MRAIGTTLRPPRDDLHQLGIQALFATSNPSRTNHIDSIIKIFPLEELAIQKIVIHKLGQIARDSPTASEFLVKTLNSASSDHRCETILVLRNNGLISDQHINKLGKFLSDSDPSVRLESARTLQQIGVKATLTISDIERAAASSSDSEVKAICVMIMKNVKPSR
mgnify:CR=1 FL=1